jgi:hypothetical protein
MGTRGHFVIVDPPDPRDLQNPSDKYTDQGGYERNPCNRGTLICDNAGLLFSSTAGSVLMRLSLPNAIVNGVYQPLQGAGDRVLTDMVIWGANFGDVYITQPGFYAAFTPYGLEFTIWTQDGIRMIRDTSSNMAADQDILLEFRWDRKVMVTNHTMELYVNGVLVASSSDSIGRYYLDNLYYVDGEDSSSLEPQNANFYVLDNPAGKNGLDCILRRLEISTQSGIEQSPIPIPPGPPKHWRKAHLSVEFSFEGTEGPRVSVAEPEFQTVIKKVVSLHSVGEIGAQRHLVGEDAGKATQPDALPSVPEDLPIGFEEVRKP